jgi:hypothetical protein
MALPNQIGAYNDCADVFERALHGVTRVQFADYGEAKIFQLRMTNYRALQRDETRRIYAPDDVRWGKSPYDAFVVRRPREDPDGLWWVYIEPHGSNILAIETEGASDAS